MGNKQVSKATKSATLKSLPHKHMYHPICINSKQIVFIPVFDITVSNNAKQTDILLYHTTTNKYIILPSQNIHKCPLQQFYYCSDTKVIHSLCVWGAPRPHKFYWCTWNVSNPMDIKYNQIESTTKHFFLQQTACAHINGEYHIFGEGKEHHYDREVDHYIFHPNTKNLRFVKKFESSEDIGRTKLFHMKSRNTLLYLALTFGHNYIYIICQEYNLNTKQWNKYKLYKGNVPNSVGAYKGDAVICKDERYLILLGTHSHKGNFIHFFNFKKKQWYKSKMKIIRFNDDDDSNVSSIKTVIVDNYSILLVLVIGFLRKYTKKYKLRFPAKDVNDLIIAMSFTEYLHIINDIKEHWRYCIDSIIGQ